MLAKPIAWGTVKVFKSQDVLVFARLVAVREKINTRK